MAASAAASAKSSLLRNVRARRTRQGERISGGRLAGAALASLAGLALAFLVVRASAVDALLRENPFAAAAAWPGHPGARIGVAMAEFRLRGGRVAPDTQKRALDALGRYALAEEPFVLAAVKALSVGEDARGEALLAEARRRNPRSRIARLLLLDRHLRGERITEAGDEIAALNRLVPGASQAIVLELARLVRDPKTGPSLIEVLRRDPDMRDAVLQQLATSGADPDLLLRISAGAGRSRASAPWQGLLLSKLVEQGQYDRAYRLWQGFGGSGAGTSKGLYDGGLAGLPGPEPFNWRFATGSAGVAERRQGTLEIVYYGRATTELASQLLILRPGRYRLQFQAEGDARGEGSHLSWTVTCLPGNRPIADIRLAGIESARRGVVGDFIIPAAGCGAQWLRLNGVAGEFPTEQSVTLRDLRLSGGAG